MIGASPIVILMTRVFVIFCIAQSDFVVLLECVFKPDHTLLPIGYCENLHGYNGDGSRFYQFITLKVGFKLN